MPIHPLSHKQAPKTPAWETRPADLKHAFYKGCSIYAGVFEPILHSGYGIHGTTNLAFTAILLWCFAMGFPPAFLYVFPWLAFAVYRRVTADPTQHTTFTGWPWLAMTIPGVDTYHRGRAVETFIVMALGVSLKGISEALGLFVLGAGLAAVGVMVIERMTWRARAQALHDARVLAQQYAELERDE